MIKGIDVSHHNGSPDFAKAKASGVKFVYVKATEGKTYVDPTFQPNMYNAMRAGLPVGAYHFARPDNNQPEEEARHFVDVISTFKYDLLPTLDLEKDVKGMSGAEMYQWAKAFLNELKRLTGLTGLFYTYPAFMGAKKYPELARLGGEGYPLWIAAYRSEAPSVSGWSDWTMWQYSEDEDVPGVGPCDCDYIRDLNDILIVKKESAPSVNAGFKRTLKLTSPLMRGDDVKRLQKRLNIKADGVFGPLTEQAVENWQRVHDEHGNVVKPGQGLKVDGIVGPKTWGALF